MKKLVSVIGLLGAFGLAACDSEKVAEKDAAVVEVAENGNTVIINFAGFKGDVQFPGGTAENQPLVLGSGQFIPGFEEQVVGMKVGEERDLNVIFPVEYPVADLAGQPVVFKVKLVDIVK